MSSELVQLVESAGFTTPTEIQVRTIPLAVKGHDLIASAKTGSGKTAAFSLPLIEKLKGRRGTLGLVLAPTREIALQTLETMKKFGEPMGVTSIALIGGTDVKADERALALYPTVIVGTPGRICDHLERGNLWLEFIEHLVLDEADRMLDMGFAKELNRIVNEMPANRQTLLFSATIPSTIEKLCHEILHRPERVAIGSALSVNRNVQHEVLWVPEKSRRRELIRFLERQGGTAIVFTKTKDDCTHLWRSIHAAGIHESTYISSNKSQAHREEALEGFKTGRYRVLVATDVAGRGIHVENVGCVVNFGVPEEPEDYIHRVGRTGRKDQQGKAITFATPAEAKKIRRIEEVLKERLPSRYARGVDAEMLGHPRSESERPHGRGRSEGRRDDVRSSARRDERPPRRGRGHDDERPVRDVEPRSRRERGDEALPSRRASHPPRRPLHDEPAPRRHAPRDDDRPASRPRHEEPRSARRHLDDERPAPRRRDRHEDELPPRREARRDEPGLRRSSVRDDEPRSRRGHRDDRDERPLRRPSRDEALAPRARHRGDDEPVARGRHRDDEPVQRRGHRHDERPAPSRGRSHDERPLREARAPRTDRFRDDERPVRRHRDEEPRSRGRDEEPRSRELRDDRRPAPRGREADRHERHDRAPRSGGERRHRDEDRPPRDRHDRGERRPARPERDVVADERVSPVRDAERDELLALEAEAWRVANQERHPGVWGREDESAERPFQHAAWELARARDARKQPAKRPSGGGRGAKPAPKGGSRSGGNRGRRR